MNGFTNKKCIINVMNLIFCVTTVFSCEIKADDSTPSENNIETPSVSSNVSPANLSFIAATGLISALSTDVSEIDSDALNTEGVTSSLYDGGVCKAVTFQHVISNIDSSDTPELELTIPSGMLKSGIKGNTSDVTPKKIHCIPHNRTYSDEETAQVKIVNSTQLLELLSVKNDSQGNCAVVLFYAPWCFFCSEVAPHYNALARAFPQLDILAIDAIHFSNLNSRYGTVAVPNILVFYNAKAVARFNKSERVLEKIVGFVSNITGLEGNTSVGVENVDFEGPLSSEANDVNDYLLWLSWIFVITFSTVGFCRSEIGQKILTSLSSSFSHEHHHLD